AAAAAALERQLLGRVDDERPAALLVEGVELLAREEVAVVVEQVLPRVLERVLELHVEDRAERVVVVEEGRPRCLVGAVALPVVVALSRDARVELALSRKAEEEVSLPILVEEEVAP